MIAANTSGFPGGPPGHEACVGVVGAAAVVDLTVADDPGMGGKRRAITRHIKRSGRMWIRVFPDVPVSKKPTEVRMGKGKGQPEYWVVRIEPGKIMFELDGVPTTLANEAFMLGAAKLSVRTKIVTRPGHAAVAA